MNDDRFLLQLYKQLAIIGTRMIDYCIAGKFGGDNVWQKWTDKDFGDWRINRSVKRLLTIITNFDGLNLANL